MSDRAAVRAALLADLPSVADTVISTIRDEIPAYAQLSAAQLAEVLAIATWGIERVLHLWVVDEDLAPADIQRFRGIGAVRALDGRPLPGVLRAYRLAGRSITAMVTSSFGDDLSVADAMALANLWMATIDSLTEALYDGHSEAVDRIGADRGRALADLLADLLAGRQVTITALADRSRRLGVTLPAQPTVLVVETTGAAPALSTTALDDLLVSADLARDDAVLRDVRDRRGVVVASAADIAVVIGALSGPMRGCAVEALRAADLHRAHQLADLALSLAPDHAFADRRVLDEGDAQVLALLAADPLADSGRLAGHVLSKILSPSHPHLLEGLDALLAHGSASAAAAALDLHPQTMRYRLRRIHHLTGRDLRRPWDRFVLESARLAGGQGQ